MYAEPGVAETLRVDSLGSHARLQPHQEFMIVRPRPDIHGLLTTIAMSGGVIKDTIFGDVKTEDVIAYKHTGIANKFAFGQVLRMGKGMTAGPSSEVPDVPLGSIIGFDLAQVAISCNSDEGLTNEDGSQKMVEVYFVPFKAALCRFDVGARLPTPLGNYVMTVEDADGMQKFQSGSDSKVLLPDTILKGGIRSNDNPGTKIKISVERILSHGPGKYVKKVFSAPEDGIVGKLGVFCHVMSVDLAAHGKRYRFTPWTQILATLDL